MLDPAVLGLPGDPAAAKKLFDQAFNHDKPVTPIKIDAVGSVSKHSRHLLISSKKDKVQVKQVDVQHEGKRKTEECSACRRETKSNST